MAAVTHAADRAQLATMAPRRRPEWGGTMRRAMVFGSVVALVCAGAGTAHAAGKPLKVVTTAFTSAVGSASENDDMTYTATVSRAGQTAKCASTVHWATADSTALAPGDYTGTGGDLAFAKGQTSRTVTITLGNDPVPEGSEAFTLTLSAPAAVNCKGGITANLGGVTVQTVTVSDLDLLLAVNDGQAVELSGMGLAGCNALTAQLITSTDLTLGSIGAGCDSSSPPTTTWTNTTGSPVLARIALTDASCGRTYYSDTTSFNNATTTPGTVNHAVVAPTGTPGQYQVDVNDGGAGCGLADTYSVPGQGLGNFTAQLRIYTPPVPSDGVVTLQDGEQADISYVASACNEEIYYYVLDGVATPFDQLGFPDCLDSGTLTVFNTSGGALDLKLRLFDETCDRTYDSDGGGDADHAVAFDENPMFVDINDGGGACENDDSTSEPTTGNGNLSATIATSPIP